MDSRKNFAFGVLTSGIASGATSLTVTAGHGARFPTAPFNAVIWQNDLRSPADAYFAGAAEIVRVTNISTDTFTITRAQEGTSAVNLNTGGKTYEIWAGPTVGFWTEVFVFPITVTIGDGLTEIQSGEVTWLPVPYDGTIQSATLLADRVGNIVIDIWKDTYANYPPTVADTITASAKPTLSSAIKSQDTTLTGWTKTITAGDVLKFKVDSASTVRKVVLTLKLTK